MRSDHDVAVEAFDKKMKSIQGVNFIAGEAPGGAKTKSVSIELEEKIVYSGKGADKDEK